MFCSLLTRCAIPCLHPLSSESFSSLIFSLLIFLFSDLLSAPSLLCFSSVHIVGSLTSKLPSNSIISSSSSSSSCCCCCRPCRSRSPIVVIVEEEDEEEEVVVVVVVG